MSIYDNAGVVLIPSGYKAASTDNLYSVLPANGNGDFNATRGSTATRVNKDGLIETVATNVPRLDYPLIDGVVQDCPALLLEPQRGNFGGYSEQISSWTQLRTTTLNNQAISPDGSQNASKSTVTATLGSHNPYIYQSSTVTGGANYVISIFVKKSTTKYVRLLEAYSNYGVTFNFDTEEITGNGNASSSDIGVEKYPNGWYRLSVKFIGSSSTHTQAALYLLRDVDAAQSYTGTDESAFIWGLQMEAGTYHTSYIKNASTGTTTRSADVCNGSGTSAEFNDSEGVLFAEFSALYDDGNERYIEITDGTTSNRVVIRLSPISNQIRALVSSGGTNVFSDGYVVSDTTETHKVAVVYKQNDFALWIDGVERATDTSGIAPTGLDVLNLSRSGLAFYGKTKQLMTFKTALTDSELETLTSWDSFNAMATGQLYTIE